MRYGTMLFAKQQEEQANERQRKIEEYKIISWEEVLKRNFNCIWNKDDTGTSFEGEIDSLSIEGDRITLRCKWIRAFEPVFDEDGDINRDVMCWRPWHVDNTSFSVNDTPREVPNSSNVIVQCWCGPKAFTVTSLSKVQKFVSLM